MNQQEKEKKLESKEVPEEKMIKIEKVIQQNIAENLIESQSQINTQTFNSFQKNKKQKLKKRNKKIIQKHNHVFKIKIQSFQQASREQKVEIEEEKLGQQLQERKTLTCQICTSEKVDVENDILTFPCVKHYFNTLFNEGKPLSQFFCLQGKDQCIQDRVNTDKDLEYFELLPIIEYVLGKDKFKVLEERIQTQNQVICECGQIYQLDLNDELKFNTFFCFICHQNKAMKKIETNQNNTKSCESLVDILKLLKNNELKLRMCPYCGSLVEKQDCNDCDKVRCSCGQDFNYCCSSKRSPTDAHGLHYHRPMCKFLQNLDQEQQLFLQNSIENENINPNCSECQKIQSLCPKPLDLFDECIPPEMLDKFL